MNNRALIILASILLAGIATNWVIGLTEDDMLGRDEPGNEPDLYLLGARITQFGESGEPQHELSAERMTHFPLTDVTTLKAPRLSLFPEAPSNELPWDIDATNGRLLPGSVLREEIVELWDDVAANRTRARGDAIQIQTESLTVFPNQGFAETRTPVSIENGSGRTLADGGMKAWFDEGRFEFFSSEQQRVQTLLNPSTGGD